MRRSARRSNLRSSRRVPRSARRGMRSARRAMRSARRAPRSARRAVRSSRRGPRSARKAPRSARRSKQLSPWIKHVMAYHKAHPELSYKQSMKAAKHTYKKSDPYRTLSTQ